MALKKMNKRGSTLTTLVVAMLIAIGVFGGYYLFFVEQMNNYGTPLDGKYNTTYQTLIEAQDGINKNVTSVRISLQEVEEADNTFLAAIAGFKGLGLALLLLVTFVDSSFEVFQAVFFSTDIIPMDIQSLLIIGIVAVIIFLLIAIFKGEGKM